MLVLGLHMEHEASAALVKDGVFLGSIAQERISRVKKDGFFNISTILQLLSDHNLTLDDIDFVAMGAFYVGSGIRVFSKVRYNVGNTEISTGEVFDMGWEIMYPWIYDHREEPERLTHVDIEVDILGKRFPGAFIEHHVSHCASTYYTSEYDYAAICSVDASYKGAPFSDISSFCMYGEGDKIFTLHSPHVMVGTMYDTFTQRIGLGSGLMKAGSMMGLAAYGEVLPVVYEYEKELTALFHERTIAKRSDREFWKWAWKLISGINYSLEFSKSNSDSKWAMDIAASVQYIFEKSLERVLDDLHYQTKPFNSNNLCLAGGSFLNCSFNGKYKSKTKLWNSIHIIPACGDDGTSIGAAYFAAYNILNEKRVKQPRSDYMYTGLNHTIPTFEWDNVEEIDEDYENLAKYIEEGKVIAWYNGKSEFGPRALGNRSFLANPMINEMRDHINFNIKKREWFRPFAPIVLREFATEYFEIDHDSPFMLEAIKAKDDMKHLIPSVVHVDGTSRVQTLAEEDNPKIYALIKAFQKRTGIPILLNTSLNAGGWPLVETPAEAFEIFITHEHVDILAIDGKLYKKT
jgi:carbamoyltransferase